MWGGITEYPQLSVQTTGLVVPTRTPLSLLIHSDITQETDTLSRLQKDYSSHPQKLPVGSFKVSATGLGRLPVEKSNKINYLLVKPVAE